MSRIPATVQLATPESCLVVHLFRGSSRKSQSQACAPILQSILSDHRYIKAGCGIDDDMVALYDYFDSDFDPKSRLDLGGIGKVGRQNSGLPTLCREILGYRLPKAPRSSKKPSTWSTVPLTPQQIAYCARDAWAGVAIVDRLSQLDPGTFAVQPLLEKLRANEQQPISFTSSQHATRKDAKQELTALLELYLEGETDANDEFVDQRIQELSAIIADTKNKQASSPRDDDQGGDVETSSNDSSTKLPQSLVFPVRHLGIDLR